MDILDAYVNQEPSDQNVLDVFEGEWSSRLPDSCGLVTRPGNARLFEDERITWAEEGLGGFFGKRVLELGPLEGGHSYMLQKAGAESILAIEANTRAYLKCLCIKDLLSLDRVDFRLGDFVPYLEDTSDRFDLVIASGVLYHMERPVELLASLARVTDRLFLWTHYYDQDVIQARRELKSKFARVRKAKCEGFSYEYSTQSYNEALGWRGFCGGPASTSKWLTRESLDGALKHFGFTRLQYGFEEPEHVNGPSLAVCCTK